MKLHPINDFSGVDLQAWA